MARFDDYHRTVIGYHGTTLSVALRLVTRTSSFIQSERDYDWLGRGIYFWEYSPRQALAFAKLRQKNRQKKKNKTPEDENRANEPLAVVGCMIRLGFCLDLTEIDNVQYIKDIFESYKRMREFAGESLPKNNRKYRQFDRAVFEYAYKVIEDSEPNVKVDTARGIYVPAGGGKRVWEGSWIAQDTHIQLCVRNLSSLLGTWLHYPDRLEIANVWQTLQNAGSFIGPQNPQGQEIAQDDVQSQAD